MIHLYCGDGKGKTTAALGLALRAYGAGFAVVVAQFLKTVIDMVLNRSFNPERIFGSGGMPSSHSATVCALATATGIRYGGGSFEFALAAVFAIVVMYDAMGVRQETGKQGKVLNEMMEIFTQMGKNIDVEKALKEFVGHTPLQVLMGAILGIIIAIGMCNMQFFA